MNRHLRALLIVGVVAALVLLAIGFYRQKNQEVTDRNADVAKAPIQINQELPGFEALALNGKNIRLSQLKGKVVVINFWASWCGPCIEEVPSLIKLMQSFPNDLELIAISGDSNEEDINSFMKSFPEMSNLPNIHVVWDANKKISQQYQIIRLPESFLLNRELKLVKKVSGTIDWHTEDAITYIKQLISSKENTRSVDSPVVEEEQKEKSGNAL